MESFKSFATDLKLGKYPNLSCIPDGIVDNVRLMLHFDPETRPNLYELPKVSFSSPARTKKLYLNQIHIDSASHFRFNISMISVLRH